MDNTNTTTAPEQTTKASNVPRELRDDSIKKTTVRNLSKVIEDKLLAMKDLATMEVFMPVHARMRERLKTIQQSGSARNIKIRGHWKTTQPSMHITRLKGTKINNDEAEITFSVFEADKKGNKKLYENTAEVVRENGDKINRVISAEYKVAYDVREVIKTGKPITREIIKLESIN